MPLMLRTILLHAMLADALCWRRRCCKCDMVGADDKAASAESGTLWDAALFPVCETREQAMLASLRLLSEDQQTKGMPRMSFSSCLANKDGMMQLAFRRSDSLDLARCPLAPRATTIRSQGAIVGVADAASGAGTSIRRTGAGPREDVHVRKLIHSTCMCES